ncbi:hypothetical protein ACJRO7_004603 [Eucalyptus globulus]|uniref:Proteinase inhibitor n=1 Tax=Eucalyptus globulus TaxID=34317 RepID=A0ABD3J0C8_EUCGL
MGSRSKHPYPPCCYQSDCCNRSWPKLVGQNGEKAKAVIEKDSPKVTVVLISAKDGVGLFDRCCNRVYVWYDENGNVTRPPVVG